VPGLLKKQNRKSGIKYTIKQLHYPSDKLYPLENFPYDIINCGLKIQRKNPIKDR
jgi:hypothetical protein